jgi:hypothetical protein
MVLLPPKSAKMTRHMTRRSRSYALTQGWNGIDPYHRAVQTAPDQVRSLAESLKMFASAAGRTSADVLWDTPQTGLKTFTSLTWTFRRVKWHIAGKCSELG